jgi:hypothetical protein
MNLTGRPSCADDRESITVLMRQNLALSQDSPAIAPSVQDWKYWRPHPFFTGSRGYVVHDNERLVSHGSRWPIRLRTAVGVHDAFHLIDWVADRSANGAGMKLLRECSDGLAAVFSIGGTDAGQRIVVAFGFKPANPVWTLVRPLRVSAPTGNEALRDWKFPAHFVRSAWRSVYPLVKVRSEWQCRRVALSDIPESLFPAAAENAAVSVRDARVLKHIAACPRFSRTGAYLLLESSRPIAYFILAQAGRDVRLIDFGPAGLDPRQSQMLGTYVQLSARADFADAAALVTVTTEDSVREGFMRSGLRLQRERTVRVLRLHPALREIQNFRLTMMDWDAACL